ncbi:hypothetical protein E2562_023510, partial [Oryza meyeriana var. granulata]
PPVEFLESLTLFQSVQWLLRQCTRSGWWRKGAAVRRRKRAPGQGKRSMIKKRHVYMSDRTSSCSSMTRRTAHPPSTSATVPQLAIVGWARPACKITHR